MGLLSYKPERPNPMCPHSEYKYRPHIFHHKMRCVKLIIESINLIKIGSQTVYLQHEVYNMMKYILSVEIGRECTGMATDTRK